MQKVFVMYKLAPGVTRDDYRKWSVDVDQRITPFQPGIIRFDVWEIEGAEGGEAPFDIVETIEIDSWEEYQKTVQGEGMSQVATDFERMADQSTVKIIYGRKVK